MFGIVVAPTIIGQPTSVLASNSASASFTVTAAGTAPLSYKWLMNAAPLAANSRISGTATNILVVSNIMASDAGLYSVVVSNSAGSATSAPAMLALDLPVKSLPTVNFTSPSPNEKLASSAVTLSGAAKSSLGLAAVWCRVNTNSWVPATTANGWSNWTANATLAPYTNTLYACAADAAGNLSAVKAVNMIYTDTATLTVTTNGLGTLSPGLNGQSLQIGKTYSLTATPKTGYVFSGWSLSTNGVTFFSSANPALTFVMRAGLQLTANFAANPEPMEVTFSVSATSIVEGQSFTAQVTVKNTDSATLNGVYVAEEELNIAGGSTGFAVPVKFIAPVITSIAPGKSATFTQGFKATTAGTVRLYCDINSSLGSSGTNYSPIITIYQTKLGLQAETDQSGHGQVSVGGITVPISLSDEATGSTLSGFTLGLALDPNRKGQAVLAAIDTAGRYPPQFFLLRGPSAPTENAERKSNVEASLTQPVSLPVDQPCGGTGTTFQNIMTPVTTAALPSLAQLPEPPSPSLPDTDQPAMSVVLDALESAGVAAKNLVISKKEVECDEVLADDAAGLAAGKATDVLFGELPEKFLEEFAPGTAGIYTAYMTADTANAYYQAYRDVRLCNGSSSQGVLQQTTLIPSVKPYFESSFLTWNSALDSEETPLQLVTAAVQTTDENGNPISGGSIEMFSTANLGSGFRAPIDNGTADLPLIANDDYSGCVRVPGYVTQSAEISAGDTNTVLQVKMEPQPVKSATLTTALGQATGFLASGTQFTVTPHFYTSSNTEVECTGQPIYYVHNPVGSTVATVDSATGAVTIGDGCGAATVYVWCNGIESAPLLVSSDCNGNQPPAPPSSFVVNPTHLSFAAVEGQGNPGSQTVFVVDLTSNTLNFSATASRSWIGVSAGSGTITVSADASGLAAGTYTGEIDIVDTAATQNQAVVGVTLVIRSMPSSGGGGGSKFNGAWSGTYTGIYTYTDGSTENPFDGGVDLIITDGAISAQSPVDGTGTVDAAGNGSWQATPDENETPFIFTGTFTGSGTASGTWTVTIPTSNPGQSGHGSGTWNATRDAIP